MVRQSLLTALTLSLMLCLPLADCWGRGFGGGGRGGGGGGRGGSFGGGGHSSGSFGGGDRGGSFGGGGHSSSGFGSGGGRGGSFGGGEHSPSGFGGGQGGGAGLGGAFHGGTGAGGPGAAGAGGGRMGGGTGFGGQHSGAGAGGFGRGGSGSPSRTQLNSFLGMPSDGGLHHLGDATGGAGGAGRPGVGVGGAGRPGVGVGGAGRPGIGAGGAGFNHVSPSARYTNAAAIRGNFNHPGVYGAGWYTAHPGAWHAAGWGVGAAWRAASWASVGAWIDYYPSTTPVYYDYGNNVTYQDNSVYVNGQDQGTSSQYYQQAQTLANTGAQPQTTGDEQWMPLGVFALTKTGQTSSDVTIQLAVNKLGVIRGNYTDTKTDKTQLIEGSVDKQTQRVAFTVGDNKSDVIETGIYNLTKDEAPVLIHFGKDRTEQWLLVRLKQQKGQSQNSS